MNRYPLQQSNIGNIVISPFLTAHELGYTESPEKLTQILCKFNYRDILITLGRINLLLQRSKNFLSDEEVLKEAFCPDVWLVTIGASSELRGRFIFNRQSTLHLLSECARVSDPDST